MCCMPPDFHFPAHTARVGVRAHIAHMPRIGHPKRETRWLPMLWTASTKFLCSGGRGEELSGRCALRRRLGPGRPLAWGKSSLPKVATTGRVFPGKRRLAFRGGSASWRSSCFRHVEQKFRPTEQWTTAIVIVWKHWLRVFARLMEESILTTYRGSSYQQQTTFASLRFVPGAAESGTARRLVGAGTPLQEVATNGCCSDHPRPKPIMTLHAQTPETGWSFLEPFQVSPLLSTRTIDIQSQGWIYRYSKVHALVELQSWPFLKRWPARYAFVVLQPSNFPVPHELSCAKACQGPTMRAVRTRGPTAVHHVLGSLDCWKAKGFRHLVYVLTTIDLETVLEHGQQIAQKLENPRPGTAEKPKTSGQIDNGKKLPKNWRPIDRLWEELSPKIAAIDSFILLLKT